MTKAYQPEAGARVVVTSSEFGDWIYITAGAPISGRQYVIVPAGAVNSHRFYRVEDSDLEAYTELAPDAVSKTGIYYSSLNGRTVIQQTAVLDTAATIRASIDGTTPASVSLDTDHRFQNFAIGGPTEQYEAPLRNISPSNDHVTYAFVTEDGSHVVAAHAESIAGITGTVRPWVYRLERSGATTVATEVTKARPSFIDDFYASLPIPHTIGSTFSPSSTTRDLPFAGNGAFEVQTADPYQDTVAQIWTLASISRWRFVQTTPYYDTYTGEICLIAHMPYISSLTVTPVGGGLADIAASSGVRTELRVLDTTTGEWELRHAEDLPDVRRGAVTGVTDPPTGLQTLGDVGYGADRYNRPRTLNASASYRPASIFGSPASYNAVYENPDGTFTARRSGADLFTFSGTFASPSYYFGSEAFLLGTLWAGPWGSSASMGALRNFLSATGRKLYSHDGAGTHKYWEEGALAETLTDSAALPAASTATLLTHGGNAAGFYGIETFHGWRYDEQDRFKAKVWTRVQSGLTAVLQGGSLTIAGFGTFSIPSVPAAPNDGFSLDGTLYVAADGAGGFDTFTEEQLAAAFGAASATFAPNGVQHTASASPPTWEKKVVDLEFVEGALKVVKTYSDVAIQVPSRGNELSEYIGPAPTVSVTEAALVQDYLVLRDPDRDVPA